MHFVMIRYYSEIFINIFGYSEFDLMSNNFSFAHNFKHRTDENNAFGGIRQIIWKKKLGKVLICIHWKLVKKLRQ